VPVRRAGRSACATTIELNKTFGRASPQNSILGPAMTENSQHAFDHREAIAHITKDDPRLAALIEKSIEFKLNIDEEQTPYESLLRAIAYQSIAGKAAAVIFGRIKALGTNGRCPTPEELLRVRPQKLRKAGLSAAKIAAVRDLAQKNNRRNRPHDGGCAENVRPGISRAL
jgi:3-methyladenine DNA glycosylase/8-oxoguanine DNA glycosylase